MAGTYGAMPGDNTQQSYPGQANQGDMPQSGEARRNLIESERYDRSLESNRKFRQARMRKECGPITDPQLRQSCLASFNQDEPYTGSSTPHRNHNPDQITGGPNSVINNPGQLLGGPNSVINNPGQLLGGPGSLFNGIETRPWN